MTEPAELHGRRIHRAAHAIQALRDTALDRAGIPFTHWQVLDKAGGRTRDALTYQLVELTVDDETGVARAIDELHDQGLLSTDSQGALEPTTQGQAVHERVNAVRTGLHDELYRDIAAGDLTTTRRVLDQITERATAMARSATCPGSRSASEWNASYRGSPHWDLDRPQPAFRALAEAGAIRGRVLDVGCGTGEHVLMAAGLGLDATGVDVAPAALRVAEVKAHDRSLPARFLHHDARALSELGESFDTVLDCGLFHIFDDEDRAAYVDSVRFVMVPGGRYFVLCFSDQEPGSGGPRRVTHAEITTAFACGWRVDSVEPTTLDTPTGPDGIRGWLIALTRT